MAYINGKKVLFSAKAEFHGLDTSGVTSFENFARYDRFTDEQLAKIDTSNGTNFEYALRECENLITAPKWNTSNGIKFDYMFYKCANLQNIPAYDFSKGESFKDTFAYCNITSAPDFNMENSMFFDYMFAYCRILEEVGVLNTRSGYIFSAMFKGNYKLHTIKGIDLSGDLSGQKLYCDDMFLQCYELANINFVGHINRNVVGLSFSPCTKLTVQSLMNIINALEDTGGLIMGSAPQITLGATNKEKLTDEQLAIGLNKGWVIY